MSKINAIKNYITPRLRLARMNLKSSINEAKRINSEDNVFKRIKSDLSELKQDIKESYTTGEVFTSGVTDKKAKSLLDGSKSGLEAYAKANRINIVFHTPMKPCECGANDFEKPLTVSVDSRKGVFGDWQFNCRTIDGDADKLTKFAKTKDLKHGDKYISVTSTSEDTFLKRVYRTVQNLKENVDIKNEGDYDIH